MKWQKLISPGVKTKKQKSIIKNYWKRGNTGMMICHKL